MPLDMRILVRIEQIESRIEDIWKKIADLSDKMQPLMDIVERVEKLEKEMVSQKTDLDFEVGEADIPKGGI